MPRLDQISCVRASRSKGHWSCGRMLDMLPPLYGMPQQRVVDQTTRHHDVGILKSRAKVAHDQAQDAIATRHARKT